MNQEGQAYSTFKLLIAAIVAMAILAILIPIIMNVMGLITADPTNEARSLLSDLVGSPGAIKRTTEVTFTPDSVLAASALAERLPISADQICMSTGQFAQDEDAGFNCLNCDGSSGSPHRLIYNGSSNLTAKIAVVCNVSLAELTTDIGDYGLSDYEEDVTDACGICEDKGKCCAIVLERS